jgi:hypothetical protein
MTITLDGTLGITSPAETVQGALTTTGNTILGDASTDTLNVGNGGLVKNASGNVSIGAATTTAKLWVDSGRVGLTNTYKLGWHSNPSHGDLGNYITGDDGANYVAIATNSAEQMRIDSAGLLQFNSGYGSVATAYGCRAWVNFNGTGTPAIRASGNVSSITDNGTGVYTVNFTTALPDANYSVQANVTDDSANNRLINVQGTFGTYQTTSSVRVAVAAIGVGVVDPQGVFVAIFR